jgi:TolB protein
MRKFLPIATLVLLLSACSSSKKTVRTEIDIAPGITGNARELVRVTNDPIPEFGPKVSPDSKKIIFYTRDDNKKGLDRWSIVYIKVGEPGRIPLVGSYTADPNWLPDSKGILFQYLQPSKPVICRGNIEGSTGISYVSPSGMGDFDGSPFASRDGKKILFETKIGSSYQICMMDASGNNFTVLTKGQNPCWDPTGNFFVYHNLVGKNNQLFSYDMRTGQSTQLTSGDHDNYNASINAKGDKIVFVSTRAKNSHIFISGVGGSDVVQVTQGNTQNAYPVWGFNGPNELIYFCSNAGGSIEKKKTTTTTYRGNIYSTQQQVIIEKNVSLAEYSDIWSVQVR